MVTVDSYGWTSDPAPQCQPADIPASIPVRGDEPGLESAWVLEHRNHEQNYVQARRAYWALGLASDHICPVIIRTQTFFQLWSRPLRVVFVDASHEYDRTFLEIQGSLAHLCEDGWLVFHDYYPSEWGRGVIRAVNELLDGVVGWDKRVYRAGLSLVLVHFVCRLPL